MPGSKFNSHKLHSALRDIGVERWKQHIALEAGEIPWDCADIDADVGLKLGVLGEEFGEVCKAVIENAPTAELREELIQVAAVACAMAEAL